MVAWEVEFTDEFEAWWQGLAEEVQEKVRASVKLLEDLGVNLGFPHCSGVAHSRHGAMRELRVQVQGEPFRILYAFDPRRVAILLIGGSKTGQDRWYETFIPLADDLYDAHLAAIKREYNHGKEV